jgi:uncharacterized protein YkwD
MDGGQATPSHSDASAGSDATTSSSDGGSPSTADAFIQHNLDALNAYRQTVGAPPLVLDATLSAFALAGSQQLSQDHVPHAHFKAVSDAGTLWSSGFASKTGTSTAGENQGDPNGWLQLDPDPAKNEMAQIDAVLAAMWAEGPGTGMDHGHYENIVATKYKRVGIGLLEVGGKLYLTNDFAGPP